MSEEPQPTSALREVALELETHVGADGWDQPTRLFALVGTADLAQREPALAERLGIAALDSVGKVENALTPIEQEINSDGDLEALLATIEWPGPVVGCAVVIERVMLPPAAEAELPSDADDLRRMVAEHPDRREVRIVVGVTRDGCRHNLVRARAVPEGQLLEGPDLVPGLTERLLQTLT